MSKTKKTPPTPGSTGSPIGRVVHVLQPVGPLPGTVTVKMLDNLTTAKFPLTSPTSISLGDLVELWGSPPGFVRPYKPSVRSYKPPGTLQRLTNAVATMSVTTREAEEVFRKMGKAIAAKSDKVMLDALHGAASMGGLTSTRDDVGASMNAASANGLSLVDVCRAILAGAEGPDSGRPSPYGPINASLMDGRVVDVRVDGARGGLIGAQLRDAGTLALGASASLFERHKRDAPFRRLVCIIGSAMRVGEDEFDPSEIVAAALVALVRVGAGEPCGLEATP